LTARTAATMAPTYLETLSAFTTFLTAYTHTLLYLRTLYPRTSFVHSRFHNTSVYQSRHPLVCEWIRDAVAAVREELLQGTVARIGIVVFSYRGEDKTGSAKIMERYMFDVSAFPVVEKNERNMGIEWDRNSSSPPSPTGSDNEDSNARMKGKQKALDVDVDTNLSEQFRAALIALTTRTSQLAPLPPHCSFNVSMELKDEGDVDPPIGHPQPWIPVQPSLQKTGRKATSRNEDEEEEIEAGTRRNEQEGKDLGGVKVTPIRSVEAGVFRFETWVEEGKAKFEMEEQGSSKTSFASSWD
ncbi:DNA-binding protein, partial [Cucurbitaria berberidis CBS 394.84]